MNDWNSNSSTDYLDNFNKAAMHGQSFHTKVISHATTQQEPIPTNYVEHIIIYEELSALGKLNYRFDRFVKKVGGRTGAFLVLAVLFIVFMSLVAFVIHTRQHRTQFRWDGSTFSLISVDRVSGRNMILNDQHGKELVLTANRDVRSISYLDYSLEVDIGIRRLWIYSFSDGSSGNKSREQDPDGRITIAGSQHFSPTYAIGEQIRAGSYPIGHVPHFTELQQAESVFMSQLIHFYEGYVSVEQLVLIMLGSILAWLFWMWSQFNRERLHDATRLMKRVWQAELEDELLADLKGMISVFKLLLGLVPIVILAIYFMNVGW